MRSERAVISWETMIYSMHGDAPVEGEERVGIGDGEEGTRGHEGRKWNGD